ncbi:MAG: hypothetical protein MZV70_44580 [Desulfobacterales bacterium]|nr:hypothetical protein [Desulfobacterales bacterium]
MSARSRRRLRGQAGHGRRSVPILPHHAADADRRAAGGVHQRRGAGRGFHPGRQRALAS